jgi:hypothetical protein
MNAGSTCRVRLGVDKRYINVVCSVGYNCPGTVSNCKNQCNIIEYILNKRPSEWKRKKI